jgi:hypothetical protein
VTPPIVVTDTGILLAVAFGSEVDSQAALAQSALTQAVGRKFGYLPLPVSRPSWTGSLRSSTPSSAPSKPRPPSRFGMIPRRRASPRRSGSYSVSSTSIPRRVPATFGPSERTWSPGLRVVRRPPW